MQTLSGNFDLAERIAGDVAHTAPVIKPILVALHKRLSLNEICAIFQAGSCDMHVVSVILSDPECQAALSEYDLFGNLETNYIGCAAFQ